MKNLLFLALIISTHVYGGAISSLGEVVGFGKFEGQTDDGGRCSVEIDKVGTNKARVYLSNPRIFKFEFDDNAPTEMTSQILRISGPTISEGNGQVTTTLVVEHGRSIGFERKFCTTKCWVSMRPCVLY